MLNGNIKLIHRFFFISYEWSPPRKKIKQEHSPVSGRAPIQRGSHDLCPLALDELLQGETAVEKMRKVTVRVMMQVRTPVLKAHCTCHSGNPQWTVSKDIVTMAQSKSAGENLTEIIHVTRCISST
jgi:hypothetical protein